jgi:hypothetical protein
MIPKYLTKMDIEKILLYKNNLINKTGCFGVEVYFQI